MQELQQRIQDSKAKKGKGTDELPEEQQLAALQAELRTMPLVDPRFSFKGEHSDGHLIGNVLSVSAETLH